MVRVKICGITNITDAMASVEAGADALGFVFAESPRQVDIHTVRDILDRLPPFITTVGVFAGLHAMEICRIWSTTGLHYAQLHDADEHMMAFISKEIENGWNRTICAVRIKADEDIRRAINDQVVCSSAAILLDTHVEGLMGGTGRTFDWTLAAKAKSLGKPIVLAGGLRPENVADAVRMVRPYAVDVSTGVEAMPGKKDHAKVKEFIQNAKRNT